MVFKKSIVYNLLGSVFDKGLPLIISIFITKFMTVEGYGKWSLLYTFMLVAYAFGASPLLTIFSRRFFKQDPGNEKMFLYFYKVVITLQILCIGVFYTFFNDFSYVAFIEIPTIICINIYSYLALFYRFKGWDKIYMVESLIRFVSFGVLLLIILLVKGQISYPLLVLLYILCHVPSLIKAFKYISFDPKIEKSELREFFSLSAYGLSSSLLTGVDRFIIIGAGYGFGFLGYYSFIYTLANTPSIIVEAFKKTINPVMYKDLTDLDRLSSTTIRLIFYILGILLIFQIIIPPAVYYVLDYLNLINEDFLKGDAYKHIRILSLGMFFVAIYQIISPYYFFYKKTNSLLIILLGCLGVYALTVSYMMELSKIGYQDFMWLKTALLVMITLLCLIIRLKRHDGVTNTK